MKKTIPILLLLILLASALLLIITSAISASSLPSPFLIAAAIVSTVALFGAVFSLYAERRSRNRVRDEVQLIHKR